MNDLSRTAIITDELREPLVRHLTKKIHSREDACDIAQEAFLRMFAFQQSQTVNNTQAFLYKTANNLLIDQIRHTKVRDRYMITESSAANSYDADRQFAPSVERIVCAEEELNLISSVVEKMPAKLRRAFVLHRTRDLSHTQIAELMGVSASMVEKYIAQALKLIRAELLK